MELIQSKKMPLPIIYLVEDEEELNSIPIGIPFIREKRENYDEIVKLIEFQVLYKSLISTGLPFNWIKILEDYGYDDLYEIPVTIGGKGGKNDEGESCYMNSTISKFILDVSYQVDFETLKNLNLIPAFYKDVEKAVRENITHTILYNPFLYNKKLGIAIGDVNPTDPEKNLIIVDISGSIPVSISKAVLLLSKTMSSQYYADLLITGSKSTLYPYDKVNELDVNTIYRTNGKDNDQVGFIKLISSPAKYNNVIVFGDNDYPGYKWRNEFNRRTREISVKEGKNINKWVVNHLISLHTTSETELAGYAEWFSPSSIERVKNWTKYLSSN